MKPGDRPGNGEGAVGGRRMVSLARGAAFAAGLALLAASGGCGPKAPPGAGPARPGVGETGDASWYGPTFHGRRTASGERYNMMGLTAAHKTLPFQTYVRVTSRANGRSLVVRINDRGPFVHGRVIDLSYAAARILDLTSAGVAKVTLSPLDAQEGRRVHDRQVELLRRKGVEGWTAGDLSRVGASAD